MSSQIIDGRKISKEILDSISEKTNILLTKHNKTPGLAVVYIGDDEASEVYANTIIKKSQKAGYNSKKYTFSGSVHQEEVFNLIKELNNDESINGIIIQFPLPRTINQDRLKSLLSPAKDVDCVNPITVGKMFTGLDSFLPCTPKGAVKLIKSLNVDLTGKRAVVIGRSNIVGKPVAELLVKENLTVTICHSRTKNIEEHLKNADVVVAAAGKPKLIKGEHIKEKAIVIDVGTNVVDGNLVGDVDFEKASEKASFITPVPGGVGPMTIAMLLENTLEACLKQWELEL